MSTTLDPQPLVDKKRGQASASTTTTATLEDHVPMALRFPRVLAGFVALIGAVYWCYSFQRLHHTDLWGHLAYGRLLCHDARSAGDRTLDAAGRRSAVRRHGLAGAGAGLPGSGPLGAAGSAVSACGGHRRVPGIAGLRGFYRRTRSFAISAAGLALFETLNWYQFQIVRPQMAGLVCFVLLLALLTARRWRPVYWGAIPLTIAVWANLHGSFVVGLVLMACACLGRTIDVWRRTGKSDRSDSRRAAYAGCSS